LLRNYNFLASRIHTYSSGALSLCWRRITSEYVEEGDRYIEKDRCGRPFSNLPGLKPRH
jgi:hypothetical protein